MGALSEEIIKRLFAVPCDHDLVNLGDDAVLSEGAHGENYLILVVLYEEYGPLTHTDSPGSHFWRRLILAVPASA